jgi:hypothetical protein
LSGKKGKGNEVPAPTKLDEMHDQEMEDFFNRNLNKESFFDNEDDKIIMESKKESEYAKRFIDYEGMMNPAIIQSQEHLKMHRQSVSSLFIKKRPPPPVVEEKIEEKKSTE